MFSICCATHECDSTETNFQLSSCSFQVCSSSDCSTIWRNVFSHSGHLSWARQIFVSFLKRQMQLHLKQWADVLNYRPGQSRTRWKYMLIKFAACLSILFVFCRNNLHLFSFFHLSPVPTPAICHFPSKNISQTTFTLSTPSNIMECKKTLQTKCFILRIVSLWWIGAFLLIRLTARIMSFWQTAPPTLGRSEENCGTGDSKESIHFTPNSSLLWARRRSDARIRFPNLNAFSVCTPAPRITACYSLAGRDLFTSTLLRRGGDYCSPSLTYRATTFENGEMRWREQGQMWCLCVAVLTIKMLVDLTERPIQTRRWQMWSRIGLAPRQNATHLCFQIPD